MSDFLGQDLTAGDPVLIVTGHYKEFKRGVVLNFTTKKVRVMTYFETLVFPAQVVRVDEALTRTPEWDHIRERAGKFLDTARPGK